MTHPLIRRAGAVVLPILSLVLLAGASVAQTPKSDRDQPSEQRQEQLDPKGPAGPESGAETEAKPPAKSDLEAMNDPLSAIVKNSNLNTKLGRAELRDNLYALLATAESEEVAKRIGERLEKLWVESGSDTVALLLMRAGASLKAKDASLALKFLDAAVDLAPDFAEAWNRRAYVHYELGDLRGAVGDLRRTLALDPNHFKALQGLGSILKETGDDAGALKAYERLIEVHPYAEDAEKAYQELRGKVRGRGI